MKEDYHGKEWFDNAKYFMFGDCKRIDCFVCDGVGSCEDTCGYAIRTHCAFANDYINRIQNGEV